MQALVAGVDDNVPDPSRPPQARGPLLALASRDQSVVTPIGAGGAQLVQALCYEKAGPPLNCRLPVDRSDYIRFRKVVPGDFVLGDNQASVALFTDLAIAKWNHAAHPGARLRDPVRAGNGTLADDIAL